MANTINIPKTHVIMGLSLPLAILIGYFLAEPMELGSMAVVVFVLAVLCVPLMLKWYYPMLVFSWNAALTPVFLPGSPSLWALLAFGGLLICVLSRAVNANARLLHVPSVTKPLLFLAAVVIGTAMIRGGIGVRVLGSDTYGGKKYFYMMAAVAGYFVFISRRIPPEKAALYVGLFFLSGVTDAFADIVYALGPKFQFILAVTSSDYATDQAGQSQAMVTGGGIVRMGGLGFLGNSAYIYLLARFGIRGLLDMNRPWRLLFLILSLVAGLAGGFRSFVVLFALTFAALFYLEGLHRTRYLAIIGGTVLLGCAVMLPHANKLPLVAQRALCFLPGKFDLMALDSAKASTDWRIQMWKEVLPDVPRYLLCGKGFSLDANDLYMALETGNRMSGAGTASTIVAGDYHSGPLSVVIPFGIWGTVAFLWFLYAGGRLLQRTCRRSSPALEKVNTLLLALFAARVFFFFFGFGSLHSDLAVFTGILGLSIALNGTEEAAVEEARHEDAGAELKTEYVRA